MSWWEEEKSRNSGRIDREVIMRRGIKDYFEIFTVKRRFLKVIFYREYKFVTTGSRRSSGAKWSTHVASKLERGVLGTNLRRQHSKVYLENQSTEKNFDRPKLSPLPVVSFPLVKLTERLRTEIIISFFFVFFCFSSHISQRSTESNFTPHGRGSGHVVSIWGWSLAEIR